MGKALFDSFVFGISFASLMLLADDQEDLSS